MRRVLGFLTVLVTPAFLLAQHGAEGHGDGSAGVTHSAGIGLSPITPFRMPQTIGLSSPSYGNTRLGSYPSYSRSYGSRNGSGSRYNRRGYGYPYTFVAAPYYLPFDSQFYGDDSYGPDVEGGGGPPFGPSPENIGASQLSAQVQQLSAQLNDLQNQLNQGPNAGPGAPGTSATPPEPASPPLTLVLNSGKTLQVQNYAVVGDTFWDLSSEPTRKIPAAQIDIPASARASEANGVEFPKISGK